MISVIVPVYKVPELYLRKCIESIVAQSYLNIEILLIDDGSPDDCGTICDTYATSDHRIRVIHQTNGGLSAARNTGFNEASGKWIMFVDGDDWIEPNMIEKLHKATGKEKDIQLAFCAVNKDYGSHTVPLKCFGLEHEHVYQYDEIKILQSRLLQYKGNIAMAYAKLYLKSFLVEHAVLHNEEFKLGVEGLDFNLRAFEYLQKAIFINEYLYHYIYNDNSITASFNERNKLLGLLGFKRIHEFIEISDNNTILMPLFFDRLQFAVIGSAINGYFNPSNQMNYKEKVDKFKIYIMDENVVKALKMKHYADDFDFIHKITLILIKNRCFFALDIIARLRYMTIKRKMV